MLKIMEIENEIECFRAWLKDYVKDRKIVTGKDLASKLGTSPQRISHFHSGRIDDGVRTFPKISIKERRGIAKIVGIDYETAIENGKKILNKEAIPTSDIEERLAKIEATIPSLSMQVNATVDITTERHRQVIERFRQKELALKINEELAELEELDKDKLLSVLDYIQYQKKKIVEESTKKRAANGDD